MKLIFYGDEEETNWFKKRFSCPNGVPCPRNWEHGVRIDDNYPCKKCAFNTDDNFEHTNVTYMDDIGTTPDAPLLVTQLKEYTQSITNCDKCMFYSNGKCFFEYNCPSDIDTNKKSC